MNLSIDAMSKPSASGPANGPVGAPNVPLAGSNPVMARAPAPPMPRIFSSKNRRDSGRRGSFGPPPKMLLMAPIPAPISGAANGKAMS